MPTPNDPQAKLSNPEAALGGADDVPKTTYVTGSGTEPEAERRRGERTARVEPGKGPNLLMWGVGAIALLFAIVFVAAFFR